MFILLVWLPIVSVGQQRLQWGEFVVTCALTAGGWLVADSYRDMPWFAVKSARQPLKDLIIHLR